MVKYKLWKKHVLPDSVDGVFNNNVWMMNAIQVLLESIDLTTHWVKGKIFSVLQSFGLVESPLETTLFEKLMYMLLCGGFAFLFTYCMTYYQWKFEKKLREFDHEKKIKAIRRRYKDLLAREAILCSKNFGEDKEVPIGGFTSDTKIDELRKAITSIGEATDKEMKFMAEMCEYIQPFITEVTGDGVLPEELDLNDALGLLKLFANYVEEREPVRGRQPRQEDPELIRESVILKEIMLKEHPKPNEDFQISPSRPKDEQHNKLLQKSK